MATPSEAAGDLRRLTRADLADAAAIASRLDEGLGCSPIGTADLWYTEAPPVIGTARTEIAEEDAVAEIRAGCEPAEWDESGLGRMPHRWAATTPGGLAVALAGYELWRPDIAHVGVLAHRAFRSRGHAREAATRAVTEAVSAQLMVQWRCRVGNDASSRLARRLGFTWMGRQSAVALDLSDSQRVIAR